MRLTSTGAGVLAASLVALLAGLPLAALFGQDLALDDLRVWEDPYLLRVLRFSLLQAGLSTLLSVAPAILAARALARYPDLPGRRLLLGLMGLPLVVPSVAAVLGVVAVFGADGWLPLGHRLYGLTGILIAHVFFNLPLAARLLLPPLEQIPTAQRRLARQLGFTAWQGWRHLEWPALRGALPGTALLVFMLCLTSFAVVLTLGGGPRSTTLEVAIYQSLRYDFDPGRAAMLATMQLLLCATLAAAAAHLTVHRASEIDATAAVLATAGGRGARLFDAAVLTMAVGLVGTVLAAIFIDGLKGPVTEVLTTPAVWRGTAQSGLIAVGATLLATTAGWLIVKGASDLAAGGSGRSAHALEIAGSIVYVIPPLVIGTGYFLLFRGRVDLDRLTIPVVVTVNAMMGLPFVIRSLAPAARQRALEYQRLCQSLGLRGWRRFRIVDFPLLRRPLGLAAALVAALSFGDLGVVALFASGEQATLPLLLYQYMSAYRLPAAAVIAMILLSACLALFVLIERVLGGGRHAAR